MKYNVKSSVVRLYLFFVNLLIWIFGLVLFVFALFLSLDKTNTPEILGNYLFNAGVYVVLFSAVFLLILPIWGYVAMLRNSRLMILMYILGLAIMTLITFCGGISLLVFPAPLQSAVMTAMNRTLVQEYGKRGIITESWDFVQSQLRCCAVADNGWDAYKGSWWDLSVNAYIYNIDAQLQENSLFYKRVPLSCCLTLIEPLTGHPTTTFRNMEQCQNWQYGPPRFNSGAHNDAIYYRGCFTSLKSFLDRFSKPIGALTLIVSFILIFAVVCAILLLRSVRDQPKYKQPVY